MGLGMFGQTGASTKRFLTATC